MSIYNALRQVSDARACSTSLADNASVSIKNLDELRSIQGSQVELARVAVPVAQKVKKISSSEHIRQSGPDRNSTSSSLEMTSARQILDTRHTSITNEQIFSLSRKRKAVSLAPSASTTTIYCSSKVGPALGRGHGSCERGAHQYHRDGEDDMEATGAKVPFEDGIKISQQEMEEEAEASAAVAAAARNKKAKTRQEREQVGADGDQQRNSISQHLDGGLKEGNNDETRDEANFKFLGSRKSGVVYGIDSKRVLKVFHDEEAGEIERQVYQRLDSHPNVAKLLEIQTDGSIILERGDPLRMICQTSSFNDTPIQTKVCWLRHTAKGYQYLHDRGIIHADIGCGNLILTKDDYVKLIDFEGYSIDGGIAGSCYEWFSYYPSTPRVTRGTDIFAFGCAIYEVSTGRPPHHQLEISDNKYKEVEELYANKIFPNVAKLPLGQLV